jgi:hypothetical protein
MGEMRSAYTIFVGKPERKMPLERPRSRNKDDIEMDLEDLGLTNFLPLSRGYRLNSNGRSCVKTVMHLWFHIRRRIF